MSEAFDSRPRVPGTARAPAWRRIRDEPKIGMEYFNEKCTGSVNLGLVRKKVFSTEKLRF